VSPWVSLSGLPTYGTTLLSFRRFGGNSYAYGRIVQGWRVRSRVNVDNTDTPTPGDSVEITTPWAHASSWNSLGDFKWRSIVTDMSSYIPQAAQEIQVSFRTTDYQLVGNAAAPVLLDPGPGPYLDRVRIGRQVFTGPNIVMGWGVSKAADGFPSARNAMTPGENFTPTTDRYGTMDFAAPMVSIYFDRSVPPRPNTMASIAVAVHDVRRTGGVLVGICAAIVSGPHAGKAPPPWTVGDNGFFVVDADSVLGNKDWWYVDLDDEYFRGGDEIVYFWAATDAGGGFTSWPQGLTTAPGSVAQAQETTGVCSSSTPCRGSTGIPATWRALRRIPWARSTRHRKKSQTRASTRASSTCGNARGSVAAVTCTGRPSCTPWTSLGTEACTIATSFRRTGTPTLRTWPGGPRRSKQQATR